MKMGSFFWVGIFAFQWALAAEPQECFYSARDLGLSFHQSILLCTNSQSQAPVECYREVFAPLTPDQRVSLCQGAQSRAPQECFENSGELVLSYDQRTQLCNGASFLSNVPPDPELGEGIKTAPVRCFRRAAFLPLSQDQKVILCADALAAAPDAPVQCVLDSEGTGLSLDQRVRLCTQLPPSSW